MLCENAMDIEGYEGKYAVTTDGRIYSHSRVMNNPRSDKGSLVKGRWMKPATDKKGYHRICLTQDGVKATKKVHRLVAEAFIPNPHNHPTVDHLNGIKNDNRVENLEWVSNKENMRRSYTTGLRDGTQARGESQHLAKLTEDQVRVIREDNRTNTAIGRDYGVSRTAISCIKRRITWTHI